MANWSSPTTRRAGRRTPTTSRPDWSASTSTPSCASRSSGRRPARVQLLHLREPIAISTVPSEQSIRGLRQQTAAIWTAVELACEQEDFRAQSGPDVRLLLLPGLLPRGGGGDSRRRLPPAAAADDRCIGQVEAPAAPLAATSPHPGGGRPAQVRLLRPMGRPQESRPGCVAIRLSTRSSTVPRAVGDHGIIWLILSAALALRRPDKRRAAVKTAAAIGIESVVVNGPVKWVFRRQRPARGVTPISLHLRRPRTSSFPSGHATSAFCAAALLSESDPTLAPCTTAWPWSSPGAGSTSGSTMPRTWWAASSSASGSGRWPTAVPRSPGPESPEVRRPVEYLGEQLEPSPSPGTTAAPTPASPTSTWYWPWWPGRPGTSGSSLSPSTRATSPTANRRCGTTLSSFPGCWRPRPGSWCATGTRQVHGRPPGPVLGPARSQPGSAATRRTGLSAGEAGVDSAAVISAIDDGWPLETFRKEHEAAVAEHQVFGVPTFISSGGAVFVRLLDQPGRDCELATRTVERIIDLNDRVGVSQRVQENIDSPLTRGNPLH